MEPVLSRELCAIFICIFKLYITVFMLQLCLSENCRNLPAFLPLAHMCTKRRVSFPPVCVCTPMHLFYSKL